MRKFMILSVMLMLVLVSSAVIHAEALNQRSMDVTLTTPLYAEIRNLPTEEDLGVLRFSGGAYQNLSKRVYLDIVTNGRIAITPTITKPFRHTEDDNYWLRSLAYFRLADGTPIVEHRLEFNHKDAPNWSLSQVGILDGPMKYNNAYLDITASKHGADIEELRQGEYESEFVLTIAAAIG